MATSSLAGRCAPVLRLVPPSRRHSQETAQAFREMAEMAERGEIIGFAYAAIEPHRRVTVGTIGAAKTEPTLVTYWLERLMLVLLRP